MTGVGTLPSARRRGIGVALTGRLVEDARGRGAAIVFLSAADDDVARLYERLGFRRIGTACFGLPGAADDDRGGRAKSRVRAGPAPVIALAGALTIAFSAILVHQADVHPATAAFYRCAYALPVLGLLAWREHRRYGPRALGQQRLALIAGVFFAADLIFWHQAIADVGAGLATVLGNLQVVFVPVRRLGGAAEAPGAADPGRAAADADRRLLISGVLEDGAYGDHPLRGVLFGR